MANAGQSIGVGVWGLGRHAQRNILPAIKACASTLLVGVTTRDQDVAHDVAHQYQCHAWPTPEDMLSDSEVDAVYVATPTGLHYTHGLRVLQAGKHLWCEKAITQTLSEAQELSRQSRRRDLALCEALMYLYHPQFSAISHLIADGSFGNVLSVRSQFGLPHLEQPGFRYNRELGGGALLDVAPYPLSAAIKLLGPGLTVMKSFVGRASGFDVDTHGYALLSTNAGTCVFLEWGYERAYKNEISIWGERSSLHSDLIFSKPPDYSPTLFLRDKNGGVEHVRIDPADSFALMFSAFSNAVLDPARRDDLREEIEMRARYLESLRTHD